MQLETCVFVCLDVVYFMPCVMCSSLTLSFETLNMSQLFISKSTQDKARHHRRWRSSYICIFHQAQQRVETCALCFPLSLIFHICFFFSFFKFCLFWTENASRFCNRARPPNPQPLDFVCVFLISENRRSIRRWEGENEGEAEGGEKEGK